MADIISQEEIDALLEVIEEENLSSYNSSKYTLYDYINKNESLLEQKQVTLYDFRRQNKFTKKQLKFLRLQHDKFVISIKNLLKEFYPTKKIDTMLHSVDVLMYNEFLMSLPSSTHYNILSLNPIFEAVELEINPSITSALFQGDEYYHQEENLRNVNNSKIYKDFLNIIISELQKSWYNINNNIITEIKSIETSSNRNNNFNQEQPVVMIVIEIIIGHKNSGMLNICYPINSKFIELIDKQLPKNIINKNSPLKDKIINNIETEINFTLNKKVTMKNLNELLFKNNIILFDNNINFNINNIPKFKGKFKENNKIEIIDKKD